eukprot:scaffold13826_cov50-Attheya_sp.AAC.2
MAYALTGSEDPSFVLSIPDEESPSSSPPPQRNPEDPKDGSSASTAVVEIYDSFAVRYPNPRLAQERQDRLDLLNQQQQQQQEEDVVPQFPGNNHKRRGFWNSLFSLGNTTTSLDRHGDSTFNNVDPMSRRRFEDRISYVSDEDDEDDTATGRAFLCGTNRLEVHCIPPEAHSMARFSLTNTAMNTSHCPSVLSSSTNNHDALLLPNNNMQVVVRCGMESGHVCAIVGLGWIAEFPLATHDDDDNDGSNQDTTTSSKKVPRIRQTSDREALVAMMTDKEEEPGTAKYDVGRARAALVGPNLLAVCWGPHIITTTTTANKEDANGTVIVLYRRMSDFDEANHVGWETMAIIRPTEAVVSAAIDSATVPAASNTNEEEEEHATKRRRRTRTNPTPNASSSSLPLPNPYPLGLLCVTDMVPLIVEPEEDDEEEEGGQEEVVTPMAVLAVSRLSGFIELIPIPSSLWYGPVLTPHNHKRQSRSRRSRHRRSRRQTNDGSLHYYYANVVDLTANNTRVAALTTQEHHLDITAMDVYRTTVGTNTIWDSTNHPNAPPCEFILAASGRCTSNTNSNNNEEPHNSHHGDNHDSVGECVTLWAVSTVFVPVEAAAAASSSSSKAPEVQSCDDFTVHVKFLNKLNVGRMGPDVSVFASDTIVQHWRKPRRVRLLTEPLVPNALMIQENDSSNDGDEQDTRTTDDSADDEEQIPTPAYTLSIPSPLTSLRFMPQPPPQFNTKQTNLLLAALDLNGGVTLLDCSAALRTAIHHEDGRSAPVTGYEEKRHFLDDNSDAAALMSVRCNREKMQRALSGTNYKPNGVILPTSWSSIGWWCRDDTVVSSTDSVPMLLVVASRDNNIRALCVEEFGMVENRSVMKRLLQTSVAPLESVSASRVVLAPFGAYGDSMPFLFQQGGSNKKCNLSMLTVQSLNPSVVVESLVHSGQYREALSMAEQVIQEGTDTVNMHVLLDACYKGLWEQEANADYFCKISDDAYVLEYALKLNGKTMPSDMDGLRAAYTEALKRMDKPDGPTSLEPTNAAATIRFQLVKLGSYVLMCRHFGIPATTHRFATKFVQSSVEELAMSCAVRGDITALTLCFVRHCNIKCASRRRILENIPCCVPLVSYLHLLPVYKSESSGTYFIVSDGPTEECRPISELGSYVRARHHASTYLDEADKALIVDDGDSINDVLTNVGDGENTRDDIAQWYLERALSAQESTRQFASTIEWCTEGLKRLSTSTAIAPEDMEIKAIHQLYSLRAASYHLDHIIRDGIMSSVEMTSSEFVRMDMHTIVSTILGKDTNAAEVASRNKRYLQPMLSENEFSMKCWVPISEVEKSIDANGCSSKPLEVQIQQALVAYCLQRIHAASIPTSLGVSGIEAARSKLDLRTALTICARIGGASKSSIRQSERIIPDDKMLIQFILNVCYSVVIPPSRHSRLKSDFRRDILKILWELFECLPQRVKSRETDDNELCILQDKVDMLYRHLLVFDICSTWYSTEREPVDMAALRDIEAEDSQNEKIEHWASILSSVCKEFIARLGKDQLTGSQPDHNGLILDFVSDFSELHQFCFASEVNVASILERHIVQKLLTLHRFHYLRDLLLKINPEWLPKDIVQSNIHAFVKDAMMAMAEHGSETSSKAGSRSPGEMIHGAIQCQDIIGPLFPDLASDFQSMRRYLDAANFIRNMLDCAGGSPSQSSEGFNLNLDTFNASHPLDIIESVLRANPSNVVIDCPDWSNPEYALKANASLRNHFRSKDGMLLSDEDKSPDQAANLPHLPGGRIIQLAGILGLKNPRDIFVVNNLMIVNAVRGGLEGAAAALCGPLLCEDDPLWAVGISDEKANALLLESISAVVSSERYKDLMTRKELCVASLQQLNKKQTTVKKTTQSFDVILRYFPKLEAELAQLRWFQEAPPESSKEGGHDIVHNSGSSEFLVFKAAGLVARQAKSFVDHVHQDTNRPDCFQSTEYHDGALESVFHEILKKSSIDISGLLSSWRTSENVQENDSTMEIISREIMLWCTSEAVRMFPSHFDSSSRMPQIDAVLQFYVALILDIQDKSKAKDINNALQNIFEVEASIMLQRMEELTSPSQNSPDPEIIARLRKHGYSENGSRRSAIMTNNESFRSALNWSVAHFQDPNFDAPLIFVKDSKSAHGFVDQKAIGKVRKTLHFVTQGIEGKASLIVKTTNRNTPNYSPDMVPVRGERTNIKSLSKTHTKAVEQMDSGSTTVTSKKLHFKPTESAAREETRPPPPTAISTVPPKKLVVKHTLAVPPKARSSPQSSTVQAVNNVGQKDGVSSGKLTAPKYGRPVTRSTVSTAQDQHSDSVSVTSHASFPIVVDDLKATRITTRTNNRLDDATRPPPPGTPPSRTTRPLPTRSTLRRHGARTLADASTQPKIQMSAEERRRLAQEGKRLLENARMSKLQKPAVFSNSPEQASSSSPPPQKPIIASPRALEPKKRSTVTHSIPDRVKAPISPSIKESVPADGERGWNFDDESESVLSEGGEDAKLPKEAAPDAQDGWDFDEF